VLVVPDRTDLNRLDAALAAALGPGRHVALAADLGPAERYRRWLAVRRATVRVAAGTRAAAFAPVADLGLVAIWDDGDDLHAEPRAPYPHARDVLVLRAHLANAAALLGGHARTAEAQQLLRTGWAREVTAGRSTVRAAAPRVAATGEDAELARDAGARSARLPTVAWRTARETLAAGAPVLVQVPRRGYAPALACARCRAPARCGHCSGPLAASGAGTLPACRWCGRPAADWSCPVCAATRLRAVVVGASRTAEELGRAFPGVPVRSSGGDTVLATVPAEPALVVATPGAEPRAEGGYGAALLLDGWSLLTRPDLRAAEEALRRWANAAALVRSAAAGGRVLLTADAGLPVVQALVRWDPGGFADRELAERAELGFPPAVRFASLTGAPAAVAELAAVARLPASAEPLGPVPAGEGTERLLLRVPRADGAALARALHDAAAVRSARKAPDPVRVQLDPLELF
jgi:primosomal protein N' (replication factor Y)